MIEPAPAQRDPVLPLDDSLIEVLREYDEQILAGASIESTLQHGAAGALPPELTPLVRCMTFLERTYRRRRREPLPPTKLGRFRIDRVLGQGGFGIVYLATDITLGRHVALKLPRLHTLQQPGLLERFLREARAAAGLDHPHIVPVHEAGETDGLCYIAAAYCPGPTLAAWIKEHAPQGAAPHLAAEIVARLADAVEYSHTRGVLHRDIKPGNVLLVPESAGNGVPTPGSGSIPNFGFTPRLADFGLAKVLEEAVEQGAMPLTGDVTLGTPSYMAPEQLRGSNVCHGPTTDIYALGAVLYELLTGRPPFAGANVADVLQQLQSAEPVAVRQFRRAVPRDLETICLKCLEKEPRSRYATAAGLRDDLQRFLRCEPVLARPPGPWDLTLKWMRRRPAAAALLATVAIAVSALLGLQTWHAANLGQVNSRLHDTNSELSESLQKSERLQREATSREASLLRHAYASALDRAQLDLRQLNSNNARDLLSQFVPAAGTGGDVRGVEWNYLWDQAQEMRPVREYSDGRGIPILCVALSPDKRQVATGDDSGKIVVWDLKTRALIAAWQAHDARVRALRFSADSKYLASGGSFHWLHIWDTSTWRSVHSIQAHDGTIQALDFSPDQEHIVTGGRDGLIRVWAWKSGQMAGEAQFNETLSDQVIYQVRYAGGGKRIISTGADGHVTLLDATTLLPHHVHLWNSLTKLLGADVSTDGRLLIAGGYAGALSLFRFEHETCQRLPRDPFIIHAAAVSADGRRACFGGGGGALRMLEFSEDVMTCVRESRWSGHSGNFEGMAMSSDGRLLLTGDSEGVTKLWDLDSQPRPILTSIFLPRPQGRMIDDLVFSKDGRWLAMMAHGPDGNWVGVLDQVRQRWRRIFETRGQAATAPQFSSDGERLFAIFRSPDGTGARIGSWNLSDGTGPTFESVENVITFHVSETDDELLVARTTHGGELGVWDRKNQQFTIRATAEFDSTCRLQFSADHSCVSIAKADQPLRVLNLRTGQTLAVPQRLAARPVTALHPGGGHIAFVTDYDEFRLFNLEQQLPLLSSGIRFPSGATRSIAISPDGRLLAAVSDDPMIDSGSGITLWDLRSLRRLYTLPTHDQQPWALAWSADSRTLAAGLRPKEWHDAPEVILWHLGRDE
jgi:serine/threonine protein kinase